MVFPCCVAFNFSIQEIKTEGGLIVVCAKPRKLLVAYSGNSTFTPTTYEYLLALKRFTQYDVEFLHVTHERPLQFDINDYDVVFHSYCARLCFESYVSDNYQQALANFRGLKILAVQDDYDRTSTLHAAIRKLGFHVILTCIQKEFWPLAYPLAELPRVVKIIQGLTGYVPEELVDRGLSVVPLADRKTWVAYRGREIGVKYGRLGFEKMQIGNVMREMCASRSIPHDIAMDDASRIYGDAWFKFLGSSRTMLGSESGSNAFDFDGSLEKMIESFSKERGRAPSYLEFKHVLDPLEAPFNVGQISPRIFECAMMKTPMILFRGSYSNVIEAGVHYIALEKDFSNAADILNCLEDIDYLQGFADRAYEQLVQSGKYGYRSLARLIESAIEEQYPLQIGEVCQPETEASSQEHLDRSEFATTVSDLKSTIISDRPTALPLSPEEFLSQHYFHLQRVYLIEVRRLSDALFGQLNEFAELRNQLVSILAKFLGGVRGFPVNIIRFYKFEVEKRNRFETAWALTGNGETDLVWSLPVAEQKKRHDLLVDRIEELKISFDDLRQRESRLLKKRFVCQIPNRVKLFALSAARVLKIFLNGSQ